MERSNRRQINLKKRMAPYVLIAPVVVIYTIFIAGGVTMTLKESLGYIPALGLNEISLNSYRTILGRADFIKSIGYSLYLAFVSASLSTIIGIGIAYAFVTSENGMVKRAVRRILQSGMIIPYLYVVFLTITIFSRTGFISRFLYQIGLIDGFEAFPSLIYDPMGFGIICVFVFKGTPFVALFLINVMARIGERYGDVAKTLGAKDLSILRRIYLPLSANTVIWTSAVLFAYDLGSFEVPYLLSSISPVPLSVTFYRTYTRPDLTYMPDAMAIAMVIFVVGVIAVGLYALGIRRLLKGGKS